MNENQQACGERHRTIAQIYQIFLYALALIIFTGGYKQNAHSHCNRWFPGV